MKIVIGNFCLLPVYNLLPLGRSVDCLGMGAILIVPETV